MDSPGRRTATDYGDLDRLLEDANKSLERGDRRAANQSLKQANVQVASMWGVVGGVELPEAARSLNSLTSEVQQSIAHPEEDGLQTLQTSLREIQSRFAAEARN